MSLWTTLSLIRWTNQCQIGYTSIVTMVVRNQRNSQSERGRCDPSIRYLNWATARSCLHHDTGPEMTHLPIHKDRREQIEVVKELLASSSAPSSRERPLVEFCNCHE